MSKPFTILSLIFLSFTSFIAQPKLIVTSSAFKADQMIPAKYSCEGAEVSPPLKVTGAPTGTVSIAIIVHDPDAPEPGGVTHWLIWNLPANVNISESFKGAIQGMNSDHKTGYKGMCPKDGLHHYNFIAYALDMKLALDTATDKPTLETAMQGHILAQGTLTGLYQKR